MAKKGRHAGNQFWGCSDYPSCKGTRDLQEDEANSRKTGSKGSKPELDFRLDDLQVNFFLPGNLDVKAHHTSSVVEILDSRGFLPSAKRKKFEPNENNWGWEHSDAEAFVQDEEVRPFLATMFKHFTRGSRILLPLALERHIERNLETYDRLLEESGLKSLNPDAFQFDSDEERDFAKLLLREMDRSVAICPQVNLGGWLESLRLNSNGLTSQLPAEAGCE